VPPRGFPAILALALLAAACGDGATGTTSTPGPGTTTTSEAGTTQPGVSTTTLPGSTTRPTPGVPATLLAVFDGDTLLASVGGTEEEVRLLGINTPESDECFSAEAREETASLFDAASLGLEVLDERDQYGRLLAYAYADGTLVNRVLLDGGFALALDTDHPRRAEFLAAEEAAFAARAGLWSPDACGTPVPNPPTLVGIEPDPPGPDEEDLNGEWVLLSGNGIATLDLTGWVLRDESSQNRYRFPDGFLLRPGEGVAVFTGCGEDAPEILHWCAGGPVWNNGGDTALLLDPAGNVAGRLRYSG
jgi:micrococcal nuclease